MVKTSAIYNYFLVKHTHINSILEFHKNNTEKIYDVSTVHSIILNFYSSDSNSMVTSPTEYEHQFILMYWTHQYIQKSRESLKKNTDGLIIPSYPYECHPKMLLSPHLGSRREKPSWWIHVGGNQTCTIHLVATTPIIRINCFCLAADPTFCTCPKKLK